jgi:diacylglycerol kinase (ATP)
MAGEDSGFPNVTRECPATIFVNPFAGAGRAASSLSGVRELFASRNFPAEFVSTNSADQLEDSVRNAIASGRKLVLAMGGDGTFQGLANAAFGSEAVLGILPAGGGNDLASALGLPKDPLRAAEAMLRAQPRWIDLVRSRTADGRERLYAGGGGVGLDAEAARYASGVFRCIPGRLRYVAAALWALRGFEAPTLNIEFPGTQTSPWEAQALLAGALNAPTYGGGVRLAPDAQIDDGWLDLVIVEDLNLWKVMGILPALIRSGQLQTPQMKRARVKRLRLSSNRPCFFHGDGEIIGPTPVEVEIVSHAVQILAPLAH